MPLELPAVALALMVKPITVIVTAVLAAIEAPFVIVMTTLEIVGVATVPVRP